MDCSNARLLGTLSGSRNQAELDAEELQALENHLQTCPVCASHLIGERAFDEAVAKAIREVPIPAGLAQKIHQKLGNHTKHRRPSWQALLAAGGLAACMAIGLVSYWWMQPTYLNPTLVLAELDDKVANEPEEIEAWFAQRGISMVAPVQFNYSLLRNYDVVSFQGRQVARLTFMHAEGSVTLAYLFVLPKAQFRDDDLPNQFDGRNYDLQKIFYPREIPDIVYLLAYSKGGNLEPLRRPGI